VWDNIFIETAQKIWAEKNKYKKTLNKQLEKTQPLALKLEIKGQLFALNEIKEALIKSKNKDYQKGYTTIGPHKDQIKYFFNNMEIKNTASQGEKTMFFSHLKKAEAYIVKTNSTQTEKEPIILLDDILSKLDKNNIQAVLNLFLSETQTIITHTNKEDFLGSKKINQINIHD
tara:strand:- start:941 stop:1459 length:519 start_codon:yes stop_codon:yes gene_type:complete